MPDHETGAAIPTRPPPSLLRSVSANWIWYFVVAISGFVLPRLIDTQRGQVLLGLWDFGWSLVVYISFLAFGVSSAVNRYVARYRLQQNWRRLNEIVNASLVWLVAVSAVGVLLAALLAWLVPRLLPELDPALLGTARVVVLLLALKCALQVPFGVFNGLITGYERFDLLNAIRIARDAGALLIMVSLLLTGSGLVALAATLLLAEGAGEVAKIVVARSLCRPLRIHPRYASAAALREVLGFGAKTVGQSLARGGIYQGSSLLVAVLLGPAALAVYARQRSLVMHLTRFVKQYAQVFVPRSSALQASGDLAALRELLIMSTRYGFYVALPAVLLLILLGDALLTVWMGPDYRAPAVLAVMAVGHLVFVPQMGVYSILMGLGRHGLPAVFELAAAAAALIAGVLALGVFNGGLVAAAVAMTAPLAIASGVVLPVYACRQLALPVRHYLQRALPGPVLINLPLVLVLFGARLLLADDPVYLLLTGGGLALLITALLYARFVVPAPLRARLVARLPVLRRSAPARREVSHHAA